MKRSNRLVIFVGVLLAILAFVGIVIVLNGTGGGGPSGATPPPKTSVLVATVDIAIGDPVTPDKVEAQQVDPKDVVGTPLGATSQVSGQPALFAIPKGSQVSQEAIGGGSNPSINISAMLKPGEKAIAFQVDRVTGLDFLIVPGNYVDIVLSQSITVLQPTQDTASKPAGQQRFETIAGLQGVRTVKAILQDKRVLYVSQTRVQQTTTGASPTPAPGGQAQQPQGAIDHVIVVIAGTDQDAEVIKFAQDNVSEVGPLTAILRNATDTDVEQTTGITIDQLVSKYGLRIPDIVQRLSASPAP